MRKGNKDALRFTLVELLIVVAIIATLMAILLPSLMGVKDKGRSIACQGNLKQSGIAVASYAGDYNEWLPHGGGSSVVALAGDSICWKALLAPYLGVNNPTVSKLERVLFKCPSPKPTLAIAYGDNGYYGGYGWNVAELGYVPGSTFGENWWKMTDVSRPSLTIDAGDSQDYFASDSASCFACLYIYKNADLRYIANRHSGGGNYAWVDGHVSYHKASEMMVNASTWFKRVK